MGGSGIGRTADTPPQTPSGWGCRSSHPCLSHPDSLLCLAPQTSTPPRAEFHPRGRFRTVRRPDCEGWQESSRNLGAIAASTEMAEPLCLPRATPSTQTPPVIRLVRSSQVPPYRAIGIIAAPFRRSMSQPSHSSRCMWGEASIEFSYKSSLSVSADFGGEICTSLGGRSGSCDHHQPTLWRLTCGSQGASR